MNDPIVFAIAELRAAANRLTKASLDVALKDHKNGPGCALVLAYAAEKLDAQIEILSAREPNLYQSAGVSQVTLRRLRDGERAMRISTEIETTKEITHALDEIYDGLRALQSTDDLGEELNKQVILQIDALFEKAKILEQKLKDL